MGLQLLRLHCTATSCACHQHQQWQELHVYFFAAVLAQMCLGIATLMLYLPTELGMAHQAGGVAVLTGSVVLMHVLRLPPLQLPVEAC